MERFSGSQAGLNAPGVCNSDVSPHSRRRIESRKTVCEKPAKRRTDFAKKEDERSRSGSTRKRVIAARAKTRRVRVRVSEPAPSRSRTTARVAPVANRRPETRVDVS